MNTMDTNTRDASGNTSDSGSTGVVGAIPKQSTTYPHDVLKLRSGPPDEFVCGQVPKLKLPKLRSHAVPKFVPTRLALNLDGHKSWHNELFELDWLENSASQRCVRIVEKYLEGSIGQGCRYRTWLHCRVLDQVHQSERMTWRETRALARKDKEIEPGIFEVELVTESVENTQQRWEKLQSTLAACYRDYPEPTLLIEIELVCTSFKDHDLTACPDNDLNTQLRTILQENRVHLKTLPEPDELQEELNSCNDEWFIPGAFLDNLFTRELVCRLVRQDVHLKNDDRWKKALTTTAGTIEEVFIDHIHKACTRLLASSILARLDLRCLYYLWDDPPRRNRVEGTKFMISDTDIPLSKNTKDVPSGIDSIDYEHFVNLQSKLKAYDFQDLSHQKYEVLKPGIVVPVQKLRLIGKGQSGKVFEVKVREYYPVFSPNPNERFALKSIVRAITPEDLKHESRILTTLAKVPHPHLTSLLASWSQGNCCLLLLPLATQDLHGFLRNVQPILDSTFIIWLLTQMTGLAKAVDHIHHLGPAEVGSVQVQTRWKSRRSTGYHHDLKPKNILVYANDDLKVSDFGTARLRQAISDDTSHKTGNLICDPGYEAPDSTRTGKASRPHDVWALGCIFLEMLVWSFGESGEVEAFCKERNPETEDLPLDLRYQCTGTPSFWYKQGELVKLKDAVLSRIDGLKKRFVENYVFHIVVEQIEDMLRIDIAKRSKIVEVQSVLEKMLAQAKLNIREDGEAYVTKTICAQREEYGKDIGESLDSKLGPPSTLEEDTTGDRSHHDQHGIQQ